MFKRVTEWMDEPFTNGTYVRWFVGAMVIYAIVSTIYIAVLFWDEFIEKLSKPFRALKNFFTVRVIVHRDEEAE